MKPYDDCPSPIDTHHNTLQFHPCQSKWWVFVVSNGWVIFHCIHGPQLRYAFICLWTLRLLPQFGYCGHCCYKHRGAGVLAFHCICIFGVNPQQCNCWVILFKLAKGSPQKKSTRVNLNKIICGLSFAPSGINWHSNQESSWVTPLPLTQGKRTPSWNRIHEEWGKSLQY